jgi:hypothetical protein
LISSSSIIRATYPVPQSSIGYRPSLDFDGDALTINCWLIKWVVVLWVAPFFKMFLFLSVLPGKLYWLQILGVEQL